MMSFVCFSRPHRLLSGGSELSERTTSRRSVRCHNNTFNSHPTDNATPMREHPTPSSLSLNTTVLNSKRKQMGPPKYTTPLPSPAVTVPSSPAIKHPHSHVSFPPHSSGPLSSSVSSASHLPGASPGPGSAIGRNVYDGSRIADMMKSTRSSDKGHCDYLYFEDGWWQCMELPESIVKMHKMLNPHGQLRIGVPPGGGGGVTPSAGGTGVGPPLLPLTGLGQTIPPFPIPGDRRISKY